MDELLRLSNQHGFPAPRIEELPGRYIGCFMNAFGEQLVFVHDDGERDARLYHGDVDWEPRRVSDATGVAQVEDLILDRDERAYLRACWGRNRAAAPRTRSGRPLSGVVAREQARVLRQASARPLAPPPSMPSPISREAAGATHSRGTMSGAPPPGEQLVDQRDCARWRGVLFAYS